MNDKQYYDDINNHNTNKVLYVEPNYNMDMYEKIHTVHYTHDLEDYCIYVDLMVEVYNREVSVRGQQGNTYYLFSWKSSSNGETRSFMGGKRLKLKDNTDFHILTTDYLNTHYSDVLADSKNEYQDNTELFGIDSIEISFNTYAVPQVDIHFTDIKGVSLFAPEELRHSVTFNGVPGIADNDISGSFFKCFFTFPYPRFTLMVKGFYGEPVSYEISCYDFKAKFDSKTGNFGVDAKFVGYMFSCLGDISLNALIASPYSDFLGSNYWASQGGNTSENGERQIAASDDRFYITNNDNQKVKMPTLSQIIINANKITSAISEYNNSEEVQSSSDDGKEITDYKTIQKMYNEFFNDVTKNYDSFYKFFNDTTNTAFLVLITESDNGQSPEKFLQLDDKTTFSTLINNLNQKIDDFLKDNGKSEKYKVEEGKFLGEVIKINTNSSNQQELCLNINGKINDSKYIENKLMDFVNTQNQKPDFTPIDKRYAYYFNNTKFVNNLNETIQKKTNSATEKQQKIQEERNKIIEDILGFTPTIYNTMRIIFAHLETFIHMMYTATNNVNIRNQGGAKRTIKDLNIPNEVLSGLKLDEGDVVPPWPKVANKIDDNKGYVDGWIGNYMTQGNQQPEAELVRGIVNGISCIHNKIQEMEEENSSGTSSSSSNSNTSKPFNSTIQIPTCTYDLFLNTNPFNSLGKDNKNEFDSSIFTDTIKGIVYHMWKRMVGVLAVDNKNGISLSNSKVLGVADAINFYHLYKNQLSESTKKLFVDATTDEIVNLMAKRGEWEDFGIKEELCSGDPPVLTNWNVGTTANDKALATGKTIFIGGETEQYKFLKQDNNKYVLKNSGYNSSEYPSNVIFFENIHTFDKLPNFDATEALGDYASTYRSNFYEKLIQYAPYNDNYIYDKKHSFTTDWDGPTVENIKDGITLGFKWKMSKENNNGNDGDIDTSKPSKNSGVLSKQPNDSNAFPLLNSNDDYMTLRCNDKSYMRPLFDYDKFCKKIKETNTVNEYSIPTIQWYGENFSLFTSEDYYDNTNDKYFRAFLFLDALKYHDVNNLSKQYIDESKHFVYTTEVACLLTGAYLWLMRDQRYNSFIGTNLLSNKFWKHNVNDLNPYVRERFIERFFNWVNNDSTTSGFTYFEDNLALHTKNNSLLSKTQISNFKEQLSNEKFTDKVLDTMFNDKVRENYMRISKSGLLFIREDTELMSNLMDFYIKPLLIVKPFSNSISLNDYKQENFKNNYRNYVDGFNEQLTKMLKDKRDADNKAKETKSTVKDPKTDENIEIAFYKYCKIFHDKWLGSFNEDDWLLENFFEKHFHFIDSFYNNIGKKLNLNMTNIADNLKTSIENKGCELISFISRIAQHNGVGFQCVQNFMDLNDQNYVENMRKMFKPIPYVNMSTPDSIPHFVFIYNGEPSSHLAINGGEYTDDGFILDYDNESKWPQAVLDKVDGEDSPIPAFGVTYGSQYQSYFTDISVGTEDGMITEQSLQAQALIASIHSPKKNDGSDVYCIGQDIYTNYANKSYECHVTMLGCAWVQPLMYFVLTNIPLFKGSYLIKKVSHSITPGNMVTKFTGVRMANTLSPLIKNAYHMVDNAGNLGQISGGTAAQNVESLSSINNNCPYSVYSVGGSSDSDGISSVDMNKFTEHGGYSKLNYTKTVDGSPTPNYDTIAEAITKTTIREAGWDDEIAIKLVICALYNRYVDKPDGSTIFHDKWTAYYKNTPINENAKYDKIYKWVLTIFENTPSASQLVGKTAQVTYPNPVFIYQNGQNTYVQTTSKIIELRDLQRIDSWCTSTYYSDLTKTGANTHRKLNYVLQHDYPSRKSGHVFVSKKSDSEYYWSYTPKKTEVDSESTTSNVAQDLVAAIQKTIDSNNSVNCKITSTPLNNGHIIKSDVQSELSKVFDIMLNAYSNYIEEISWVNQNMNDIYTVDYPTYGIFFKPVNGGSTKIKISISEYSNGNLKELDKYSENINSNFYKTLAKHYAPLNDTKNIRQDCLGFTGVSDEDILKWLKQVQPTDCSSVVNSSSNGSSNYPSNNNKQESYQYTPNGTQEDSSSISDFSYLVKNNDLLKRVLSNVGSIQSENYGKNFRERYHAEPKMYNGEYVIQPNKYCGCCTSGPITWYKRSGKTISFWSTSSNPIVTHENSRRFLEGHGFVCVWHGTFAEMDSFVGEQETSSNGKNKLRPGDIGTLFTGKQYHQHGIMWTGKDWRSDAIQSHAVCYNSTNQGDFAACIWRHPKYQDEGKSVDW